MFFPTASVTASRSDFGRIRVQRVPAFPPFFGHARFCPCTCHMLQRKNGLIAGSWMSVTSSPLGRISYHLSAPTISNRAIAIPALSLQQHEVAGGAAELEGHARLDHRLGRQAQHEILRRRLARSQHPVVGALEHRLAYLRFAQRDLAAGFGPDVFRPEDD